MTARSKLRHQIMKTEGWTDYPFSFHDSEELGPAILAKISKKIGPSARALALNEAARQDGIGCGAPVSWPIFGSNESAPARGFVPMINSLRRGTSDRALRFWPATDSWGGGIDSKACPNDRPSTRRQAMFP